MNRIRLETNCFTWLSGTPIRSWLRHSWVDGRCRSDKYLLQIFPVFGLFLEEIMFQKFRRCWTFWRIFLQTLGQHFPVVKILCYWRAHQISFVSAKLSLVKFTLFLKYHSNDRFQARKFQRLPFEGIAFKIVIFLLFWLPKLYFFGDIFLIILWWTIGLQKKWVTWRFFHTAWIVPCLRLPSLG